MISEALVMEALKEVHDPELGHNIVDLGLVYEVDVKDGDVHVTMTLTTPACPVGPQILEAVQMAVSVLPEVKDVDVEVIFDPPWGTDMMSEEIRFEMGLD